MLKITFQQNAISEAVQKISNILNDSSIQSQDRNLLFVSSVGSGKTYMSSQIMEILHQRGNHFFVWLSPGTGGLAEQSLKAFQNYSLKTLNLKSLDDTLLSGLEKGDVLFANWERLKTSDKNVARRYGEQKNLDEIVEEAVSKGLKPIVFIDESHIGKSSKSYEVVQMLQPEVVIELSATPKNYKGFNSLNTVMVNMVDVIQEQFLKKQVKLNAGLNAVGEEELLRAAVSKRSQIHQEFQNLNVSTVPLCLIQIENASAKSFQQDTESITQILVDLGVDDSKIAVKLSNDVSNYDDIVNSDVEYLIFKQAIATGWDVPRSHILVRLRDIKSPTFDLQTMGRILRTVEKKHYGNDIVDNAYLYSEKQVSYSFDSKLQEVLGLGTHTAHLVDFPDVTLVREFRGLKERRLAYSFVSERFTHYFPEPCQYVGSDSAITQTLTIADIETDSLYDEESVSSSFQQKEVALSNRKIQRVVANTLSNYGYNLGRKMKSYILTAKPEGVEDESTYFYHTVFENFVDITGKLDALKRDLFDEYHEFEKQTVNFEVPAAVDYAQILENRNLNYAYDLEPDLDVEYTNSASEKPFAKWLNDRGIQWFKNQEKSNNFGILYTVRSGEKDLLKTYYPDFIFVKDNVLYVVDTKAPFGKVDFDGVVEKFNFGKKYEEKYRDFVKEQGFDDFVFSMVKFDTRLTTPYILNKDTYTDDIPNWEQII